MFPIIIIDSFSPLKYEFLNALKKIEQLAVRSYYINYVTLQNLTNTHIFALSRVQIPLWLLISHKSKKRKI